MLTIRNSRRLAASLLSVSTSNSQAASRQPAVVKSRHSGALRRGIVCSALFAAVIGAGGFSAKAATKSWDPALTPGTPSGGNGTWDLVGSVWSNGGSDVTWTDTSTTGTDTAVFGGIAGSVALNTSLSALGLQFTTTGYTIAGTGTLSLGTGGIDASALTSGTTTLGNNITLIGATSQTWNTGLGSTLLVNGNVATGAVALTVSGAGATTIAGNITGAGPIIDSGAGKLSLSGVNTYTGVTTIQTGATIQYLSTTAMSTASTLTMQTGSTLQLRSDTNGIFTTSAYNPAGGSSTTIDVNQLTGAGSNNVITLGSTAGITVGGNAVTMTLNVTGGNGDSLKFTQNVTFSNNANNGWFLNPTTANFNMAGNVAGSGATGQTFTLDGTSTGNIISGVISNTLALTKSNTSTWALTGTNTFSGLTTITGGVLDLQNALALQNSALNVNGGTVKLNSIAGTAFTIGGLAGSSNFAMQNSAGAAIVLTLNPSATQTFSGTLTDGGLGSSLIKTGAGLQILNGVATYTGGTTINAGALEFGGAATHMPATGTITVNSTGTLAVNVGGAGEYTLGGSGAGTIPGLLAGTGGSGNTVVFNAGSGIGLDTTNAGGNITYAGTFVSGGNNLNLTKIGANSLILTSANAVTGSATILGGAIQLNNANALAAATVTISSANGLTFNPGSGPFAIAGLSGASNEALTDTGGAAANLVIGGTNVSTTYSGILSGTGSVTIGNGSMILTAANTYTGGTIVNSGGVLTLGRPNPGNTGAGTILGVLTINNGGTVLTTQQNALGYNNNLFVTTINVNQGGLLSDTAVGDQAVFNIFNLSGGTIQSNGGVANATTTQLLAFNGGTPGTVAIGSVVNVSSAETISSVIAGRADLRNTAPNTIFNVGDAPTVAADLLFSADMTSNGTYIKTGAGLMLITGANNTFTGTGVTLQGTTQISGTGITTATSTLAAYGGTIVVDNTAAALGGGGNNTNRLADGTIISLGGGTFLYKGSDAAATNSTETVATINGPGNGTLTVSFGGTNVATLTSGTFAHAAGNAADLVDGTNLGQDSTTAASVNRIIVTTSPTLIGTTAALATGINAAAQNTKIVPFLLGEATSTSGGKGTATGVANTFVTYIAGSGLRPLNLTDEFTNNSFVAGNNTYITSNSAVAATTAVNSLIVNGATVSINDNTTLSTTSSRPPHLPHLYYQQLRQTHYRRKHQRRRPWHQQAWHRHPHPRWHQHLHRHHHHR